ncbi:uncharacterized protein LOC113279059 [Papaver somniferum]|uniref:uncharacterized protein LOC113279059 n=1 Tax=Papaver somniferum TaxID=3469 RepID=UPI000E6F9FD0|nr:uncharacterized protein LOC113279059 [Papaver somniferum]
MESTTKNSNNKRNKDDSFELLESSLETKRIRENLLILDDDESDKSITQDLDSVMKSFEEEISLPPPEDMNNFVVGGDVDEQPDLGFLLEASDDELGLPPCNFSSSSTSTASTEEDVESNFGNSTTISEGLDQIWSFDDDQFPNYQDFGIDDENLQQQNNNIINSDLVGGDFGDGLCWDIYLKT